MSHRQHPTGGQGRDASGWAQVQALLASTRVDQVAHLRAALEHDPNLPQCWLAVRWAAELLAALDRAAEVLPSAVPQGVDPAALKAQAWAWEAWLRQRHWQQRV